MTQDPRLGSYSNWLRANQNKRDTPEWQKVANAYKSLRSSNAAPQAVAQPQTQPAIPASEKGDTSMSSAFKAADAQSQGASMSGMASLQRNLSQGPIGQFLQSTTENYINPVRELAGYDPIDRAQVEADASARLQAGADRANAEAEKIAEDLDFYNMTTSDINSVGDFVNFIGQKTAQAIPYMGAALASGGTLTYPFAVGEISQNLSEIEGLSQEKADDIAAAGGAISAALENLGIAKLLPKGASNSILGGIAGGVITEGTTEGLQELVNIGSEAVGGKQFSEGEILNRLKEAAAAGSVAGGAIKSGTQTAAKVKSLFTSDGKLNVNNLDNSTKLAAGDVARQLKQIATAEGFNLKNINISSQFGAKGALEEARKQNNGEITELVKALKDKLNSKNSKSLDQLLTDYAPANAAIKQGKNKVSGYVNKADMAALARLVGPYQEGATLMNALAKSNVITGLFKDGMKGGVSQFTDYFNPLGTSGAVYDPTRLGNVVLGGGLAASTGLSSIPVQAGIVGLGRLVDAATGRRNKLARFVNKNVNAQGLPSPSGVSLVDKAKTAAADAKVRKEALARIATQIDAPPNANSPVGTILSGTGLSRDGLSQTITRMSQDFAGQPELAPVLESIQQNMDGDTNPVLELNEIIPIIGQYAQMTAPELIVATPDNPLLARGVQQPPAQTQAQTAAPGQPRSESSINADFDALAIEKKQLEAQASSIQDEISNLSLEEAQARKQEFAARMAPIQQRLADISSQMDSLGAENQARRSGNQFTTPENYQAGRSDNNSFVRNLESKLADDTTLAPLDKAQLTTALADMQASLGPNPVEAMTEMVEDLGNMGVSQEAIDTYVKPYADRVIAQQARVGRMQAPESEDRPRFSKDLNSASQKPTLQTYVNPLNVPTTEINATRLNESPSEADIQKMREGSYKPTKKRNLVEAADYMHQKWKEATGRSEPFEYTPENVDIISTYMATEAANALQSDANAIGWYDRKLKAAKRVVSLVDPRVTQSPDAEAAFDFALAVTSNGQAVADNFQYALEVFRHFMDNGKMPTDTWIKGGERNAAMLEAFDFFNAYQSSGANMPIQDFMDQDFTVNELNSYISRFNAQYGTEIKVPSSEGANAQVKGSYIIGPKIGQGFYQNIRGNYDPLTMDIWWMRMWNRLVGRPFVADPDLDQGRSNVKGALKTVGKLEQKMVNQTLKEMGVGKRDINKDPALFDDFVTKVEKRYQKFYKKYKEENGVNHTKPNFFKKTGTHVKNLKPQLQAQPKGPSERAYMRDVTKAAIAKLSDLGYNIETADFQALMWYPEKQLFRHLGVAPGRGSDNDYLDAAIMLAEGEGIANDQIQEALPDADGDGAVNNQPSTPRGDEGLYRGDGSDGPSQEGPRFNQQPTGVAGILAQRIQGSPDGPTARGAIPDVQEVKDHANHARALIEIGKPGSDYENGIKDQRMVEHLAKAVGVTLKMFDDHNAMLDDGGFTGATRKRGEDAGGFYMRKQNIARSLAPGATVIRSGQVVAPFRSYLTALHEVAHGIAGRDIEGNLSQNVNMGKNYLTGNQDAAPIDTLEHMIGNLVTMPSAKKNKIIKEIMSLQDNESFNGDGVYYPVRPTGPAKERLKVMSPGSSAKKQLSEDITKFEKYSRSVPEFTVDPLIMYLENPKKMKSVAPETAKAIRAFFVNSSKIRFFSHPLAMAFAVVMAMLMKQEQAEEEERQQQQQMPPGALNQPMPQGMLSA